jgi:ureidoglycolate hydrolase
MAVHAKSPYKTSVLLHTLIYMQKKSDFIIVPRTGHHANISPEHII